jgi:hypothetical protein
MSGYGICAHGRCTEKAHRQVTVSGNGFSAYAARFSGRFAISTIYLSPRISRAKFPAYAATPETHMSLIDKKIESLPFVVGELNYLAPTDGKPRTYAFDPPPGEPKSTTLPEPHQVSVFNGRSISDSFSLDREGFALVRHPTVVRDFYSDKEVRAVYYPAVESFLRATLRADRVLVFDHTVRKRVEGAADVRGQGPRQPATRVHVDQTPSSGANRVREHSA